MEDLISTERSHVNGIERLNGDGLARTGHELHFEGGPVCVDKDDGTYIPLSEAVSRQIASQYDGIKLLEHGSARRLGQRIRCHETRTEVVRLHDPDGSHVCVAAIWCNQLSVDDVLGAMAARNGTALTLSGKHAEGVFKRPSVESERKEEACLGGSNRVRCGQ